MVTEVDSVEKAIAIFGDPSFVPKAVVDSLRDSLCEPYGLGVVRVDNEEPQDTENDALS